ncbi:hypothetical protein C8F04DRAFT_1238424 [Mycena alexandri]|uniref:Uncharacterized protein n=1 Tax=Mycena alexandri TaxID=1745969 RepID=A0AAD6SF54_9AGAR|nr:hypothetical protein C8F04DRAFT_1238424 [Mycena alexandri]
MGRYVAPKAKRGTWNGKVVKHQVVLQPGINPKRLSSNMPTARSKPPRSDSANEWSIEIESTYVNGGRSPTLLSLQLGFMNTTWSAVQCSVRPEKRKMTAIRRMYWTPAKAATLGYHFRARRKQQGSASGIRVRLKNAGREAPRPHRRRVRAARNLPHARAGSAFSVHLLACKTLEGGSSGFALDVDAGAVIRVIMYLASRVLGEEEHAHLRRLVQIDTKESVKHAHDVLRTEVMARAAAVLVGAVSELD